MISLKINQYLLKNFKIDTIDLLSKNSLFKGKIVDIFASKVLIDVQGKSIIPATLDADVKVSIGDELTFLVKSSSKDEIIIKAMNKEELKEFSVSREKDPNTPISKLLKSLNIDVNKKSIDLVKSLIRANTALNRENISNSIKILDKIIQLDSLADDEKVILLNQGKAENSIRAPNKEEIEIELAKNSQANSKEMSIKLDNSKEYAVKDIVLKSDIKNLLIVKEGMEFKEEDITGSIKDLLSENSNLKLKENLPKLITFFIKNEIKANLNNILNMKELNDDPQAFVDDLDKLQTLVKKELGEKLFKDLFVLEEAVLKDGSSDIENKTLEIQKLLEEVKSHTRIDIDKEVIDLKNKNDFMIDLNKNMMFNFVPMTNKKYDLDGLLNFIRKNNKKTDKNKTNVFINLNTKRIGNIKISCNFTGNSLGIKMGMQKEHLKLFEENEEALVEKMESLGYKIQSIHYALFDEVDIIDTIDTSSNSEITYYLDVKV